MANQQRPISITVPAGSDLSAKQFYFMDVNSSAKLAVASVGARVVGVLNNKPNASGQDGELQISGVAIVLAGGTITAGGSVAADAAGKAVAATGSAFVCGVAMESASSGDYIGVLLSGATAVGLAAATETVTSGAVNPAIATSFLSATGTVAYTLADGTYTGQTKRIICSVAASTPIGTLTITTPESLAGFVCSTTFVFDTVGQALDMFWTGTKWRCTRVQRAGGSGVDGVVVGTTVLTGKNLWATYTLSVTGTVTSTTTKAIPDGSASGEIIQIGCSTAASTPSGTIACSGVTTLGATGTKTLGTFNATTVWASLMWNGSQWQQTGGVTAVLA